jgi:RNA polymerase sigma-70 factor (ECF subfamily)
VRGWGRGEDRTAEFEQEALVHLDALYRAALRLTRDRAEAEDVVQETCLRAFRAFGRFTPGTNCRAWLFTILRNVFLTRVRRAGRETPVEEVGGWDSVTDRFPAAGRPPDSPEEEFFQTMLHGEIDRALQTLPLPYREAVVLADLEGLSYREVAEALGCPVGTVMSRLFRGRGLLRHALGRYAQERASLGGQG